MKNILSNSSSLRAAEYTDKQINTFWVDTQEKSFKEILGLNSPNSKYLLGAKGSGKTHLLRYHSFKVALKRFESIEKTLKSTKAVGIYLRFPNDTNKFDDLGSERGLIFFTYYMELMILRSFFDLIKDICELKVILVKDFLIKSDLISKEEKKYSVEDYLLLIKNKLEEIDEALNSYILWEDETYIKNISINYDSIFKLQNILEEIDPVFKDVNIVFLLDEYENISFTYKKVINNWVRMSIPKTSFRIAGRKQNDVYKETYLESNRKGHEFLVEDLDDIFRLNLDPKIKNEKERRLKKFIKDFINKALSVINDKIMVDIENLFGNVSDLEKYINNDFSIDSKNNEKIYKSIRDNFIKSCDFDKNIANDVFKVLSKEVNSLVYLKINIVKFSKLKGVNLNNIYQHAININQQYQNYKDGSNELSYKRAVNHYKSDVVYQLYRNLNNQKLPVYYGFDTLCKITSYNPRNVLNVLYKIEEQLLFENKDFFSNEVIDIETQSRGFREASKYFFNEDTSYGSLSLDAKKSVSKIGDYLHKARFSLKIPEISPLAISFSKDSLNDETWKIFYACIEFSLLQEAGERNDRNNSHKNCKVKLNPMLSPLWSLPVVYRGDLSINDKLVDLIFSPNKSKEFYSELNKIESRWSTISFPKLEDDALYYQGTLF
ncbi:hypothetical protein [Acinetobacter johnsonii]|uniref:ORC-CDC6 family AAA ATPase n=1 Tax=Acinetobacter johnsonii TaxID=40214 RepID=UPI001F1FA01D|nr:hypothetical protein [Acinetobacter johnsonii]UJA02502.1 hypothetical protein GBN93_16960 [Acinetobacter johnsonii]